MIEKVLWIIGELLFLAKKKRTFANLVLKGNNFCWIRGGLCKKSCISLEQAVILRDS